MIDKMKKFTCVQDIGDLKSALAEAFEIQKDRFKYVEMGRNKTRYVGIYACRIYYLSKQGGTLFVFGHDTFAVP